MWKQGARHFVFIGRSGTSKHAARDLVEDLERGGAEVQVFRGDVQDFHVVDRAVQSIRLPLGGVIQAAMGLSVSDSSCYFRFDSVLIFLRNRSLVV